MIINRLLNLNDLLKKKSYFLFGPRSTGKSTLIHQQLNGECLIINLLRNEYYRALSQEPQALESIIDAAPQYSLVVIDEVQRIPALLNEVHRLIEERNINFLLTGSSARKLRKNNVNLLAGRARKANLFPLTSAEIHDFDLLRYLHIGGLPQVYLSTEPYEELEAYVDIYLKEEIQLEALVRNIPGFSSFLQVAAITNGQIMNFTKLASDIGLPVTTVREYYFILEDTFLGFMLSAFTKTTKRKALSTAKFYFFDMGVSNYLAQIKDVPAQSVAFGGALEHFLVMEIKAFLSYNRLQYDLTFWRSTSGFEVDIIIDGTIAIEVKSCKIAHSKHFKGLLAFKEEELAKRYILVSMDPIPKKLPNGIELMPCTDFLQKLWDHKIVS
jgi:uncharacterized protein